MKPAFFSTYKCSGISIEFTKKAGCLSISGWYDSFVGITGERVTLREFFDRTGITESDCKMAFKKEEK